MSQAVVMSNSTASLTSLLVPLTDRTLLLPNVALVELIPYRAPQVIEGTPEWFLGWIAWRDLRLPLLSFEAASCGQTQEVSGTRVAVINTLGGRPEVKFIALLVQGIPHSLKVDSGLAAADVKLAPLELGAAHAGQDVVRIPDLVGLEQLLVDSGLI